MLDAVLLGLGVGVALWCALLVGYVVVQGRRDEARKASLTQGFSDRLVAIGNEGMASGIDDDFDIDAFVDDA